MSREKVTKKCKYFVILHYIRHSLCVKVARWDKGAERYTRRLLPGGSLLKQIITFALANISRTLVHFTTKGHFTGASSCALACPYNLYYKVAERYKTASLV